MKHQNEDEKKIQDKKEAIPLIHTTLSRSFVEQQLGRIFKYQFNEEEKKPLAKTNKQTTIKKSTNCW